MPTPQPNPPGLLVACETYDLDAYGHPMPAPRSAFRVDFTTSEGRRAIAHAAQVAMMRGQEFRTRPMRKGKEEASADA